MEARQTQRPQPSAGLGWLGKADKLDEVGRLIISHYEHTIIDEKKLNPATGALVDVPKIKYHSKYEPAGKARVMAENGFNPTRLGEYLLASDQTPDHVKDQVAGKMRSAKAKAYVKDQEAKQKVRFLRPALA